MSLALGIIGVILAQYFMGFSPGTWQFWAVIGYEMLCWNVGKAEAKS